MKGHSCEKYKGKERYWAQSAAFSWLFVRILYRMAIFMEKIILSGFSDEIAPGFDQQLAAVKEFGLGYIELRAADGINVSDFTPEKLRDLLRFVLPLYREEGKTVLVVAIGCTGGHHRSVAVTHALAEYAASLGYQVTENHRDMTRS